jgi:hypothetical protein
VELILEICNNRNRRTGFNPNHAVFARKLSRGPTAVTTMTTGHVPVNVKGATVIRYHELLRQKLDELRVDIYTFFRMAHIYCFGTDPDISTEVAQYTMHAIIPKYVQTYLNHIGEAP